MSRPKKSPIDRGDANRAVLYVRVSTDEQKKGFGPEVQEQLGHEYCRRRGYTVVAIEQDLAVSGTRPWTAREGLRAAMRRCLDGTADTIVAYAQDRFARKAGVWEEVGEAALAGGFRLESAQTGQVLTDQANELTSDALAFVASIERKLIVKRLRGGREGRGGVDGRGSSYLPYGYAQDAEGRVVVAAGAATVVRAILRLRRQAVTYAAIAARLNQQGIPAPRGGPWRATQVHWIAQREPLYRTGVRSWGGILAAVRWPVLDAGAEQAS